MAEYTLRVKGEGERQRGEQRDGQHLGGRPQVLARIGSVLVQLLVEQIDPREADWVPQLELHRRADRGLSLDGRSGCAATELSLHSAPLFGGRWVGHARRANLALEPKRRLGHRLIREGADAGEPQKVGNLGRPPRQRRRPALLVEEQVVQVDADQVDHGEAVRRHCPNTRGRNA
jgi:hypothetical protein